MRVIVSYTSGHYGNTTPATSYTIKVQSGSLPDKQQSVKMEVAYEEPQPGVGVNSRKKVLGFCCELSREETEVLGRLLLLASSEHFSTVCEVKAASLSGQK